ncbi:MAG: type II toxin-antitoxin system VapC family toxin [Myxococcota bacterium]
MEVSAVALDTSAYSHLRRGDERVFDALARAKTIVLPAVVVGELHVGFQLGTRALENLNVLQEFIAEFQVTVLSVNSQVARRYGELFAKLRHAGTPIPTNDIWIAATVIESSAQLLTFDSDFRAIEELRATVLKPKG